MTSLRSAVFTAATPIDVRLLAVVMAPTLALILGIDARIRGSESLLVHGLADEVAHVATALICLATARALGVPIHWVAGLAGAMVLDLDHLPVYLDLVEPIQGSTRFGTHSLTPVVVTLAAGLIVRRWRLALWTLGFAMATHLFRDASTGYVPLAWPLSDRVVHLPYAAYLAAMTLLTMISTASAVFGSARAPRSIATDPRPPRKALHDR